MKKKIIYLSFILVLVISLITLSSIYKSKDNKYKKEYNTISKEMAIMIKEKGATEYTKSTSKDIPKGNYVLNEEKTHCENNGKVTNYNSATGKISLNFIGSDRCYLYFDYKVAPRIGYEAILLDNGGGATTVEAAKAYIEGRTTSTTPDFSTVATTNEGMFAADDDYTATTGMKSYYFRGAVDNNWVKFGKYSSDIIKYRGYYSETSTKYKEYDSISACQSASSYNVNCTAYTYAKAGDDIYWRIIRINGDGSIRMIYSGTTKPSEDTSVTGSNGVYMTGTGTQISTSAFNSSHDNPSYGGYMYTVSQQYGNSTSSTIKTKLENWYKTTTLETDSDTKALISQEQIFCNDRSVTSGSFSTTDTFYYAAFRRLYYTDEKLILTCPTESDKFTSKKSSIGNKTLDYPVGLITADEVAMAGGVYGSSNTNSSYYLYTNQDYWTGSPRGFSLGYTDVLFVTSSGNLYIDYVDGSRGVRGVVSLSSKAKLSGSGTYNDVYTVVGDDSTEDTSSGKSFDTVFAANNTDIFPENGLRYEGADPNNYICLDNKTSGTCSSSSLLFRIIGLFDEDTSNDGTASSGTKILLKVIDTNNYGGTSGKYWNSAGGNNWSTASLKTELNGSYLTTLLGKSNVNSKLSSAIANAKWHLGGASLSNYNTLTAEGIYTQERNTSAIYSGNPSSVYAKIGLMYPSDYGYATVGGTTTNKSSCRAKAVYGYDTADCKNNDWLFTSKATSWGSNITEWLLSPYSSSSSYAAGLRSSGYVGLDGNYVGNSLFAVRPTFYLDSSVLKIVGTGDGSSTNPYRIG